MRRIVLASIAVLAWVLAAATAGAETLYIEKAQLVADPADPGVVRFSVQIGEPGNFLVSLLVRGESERQIELALALQPEAGGAEKTVRFSFTGRGCG